MSDNLDTLFKNLSNEFDLAEPKSGHQQRFLDKLKNQDEKVVSLTKSKNTRFLKPLMGIAASIALIISVFMSLQNNDMERDLASVSPEMATTQTFFTNAIADELLKIETEASPETQKLVEDAMKQMNILETNYTKLKQDLIDSGDDKRVIFAMITNFQNRIDLLQNVLQQIEEVKQLNNTRHENSITL
jgi:hypothetical protein